MGEAGFIYPARPYFFLPSRFVFRFLAGSCGEVQRRKVEPIALELPSLGPSLVANPVATAYGCFQGLVVRGVREEEVIAAVNIWS